MSKASDRKVLEKFLNIPVCSPRKVLEEFSKLENAFYMPKSEGDDGFVYVPGKRDDRVVLIAHADTVFYFNDKQKIIFENGIYKSGLPDCGIGADDRAGCAILYLLKDSGHSLLVLDGEENGSIGANAIKIRHRDLYDEINEHQYMIEFDRRNATDYKVYNLCVSQEFKNFIEEKTGYKEADKSSSTDIVHLCSKICGVNLSVDYYNEHYAEEFLVLEQWQHTLDVVRNMLKEPQKKFPLFFWKD